jgi:hypothetical protein
MEDAPEFRDACLSVAQVCRRLDISPATFRLWERRGVAPRRTRPRYGRAYVRDDDLAAWIALRDYHRKMAKRPGLRSPLTPEQLERLPTVRAYRRDTAPREIDPSRLKGAARAAHLRKRGETT